MSIKRTIITTILALALVAVVAPGVTQAATIAELQASIAAYQAQLAALSGTPAQTMGNCTGVTFERTLVIGSTGSDVKCLQTILNLSSTTQIAIVGAGSPGSETSYFGSLTLSAVRKYQVNHGWTPANQVGPLTRLALNAQLAGTVSTGSFPAGCTSNAGFSTITGQSCAVVTGLPAGCTSTAGYSPTTGVSCSTGVITPGTPGATGFIDATTLAASPASNASVTATANVPVLGINVKAINSNMTVNSLKVQLTTYKGTSTSGTAEHPATSVQNLYVYDGSTLLGTFPVSTSTVYKTSTGLYYVILSGFNFNIPANTTKVLTVNADFAPSLENSRYVVVNLYATDSVGAIDGTGASRTSGITTVRNYTVTYTTVGTSIMTVVANVDTPDSTDINVNTTSGTTGIPMSVFDFKSTTGASTITDLKITAIGTAAAVAKITAVNLYDGSTLIGSQSLSGTTSGSYAQFTDLTISVAKDAIKSLTVKADFAADVTNGSNVYLEIANPSTDVDFNQPNLANSAPVAITAVVGNAMYLYDGAAAVLSFVSGTATYTPAPATASAGTTNGVIVFKVKADGGTLTELTNATVIVDWNSTLLAAAKVDVSVVPDSDTSDGGIATVTVTANAPLGTTGVGFVNFKIAQINWVVGSSSASQTWGLADFKTPSVYAGL